MNATGVKLNIPSGVKVRIGSRYERTHFERRDANGFCALRPAMSADAQLLQSVLLDDRNASLELRARSATQLLMFLCLMAIPMSSIAIVLWMMLP